MSPDLQHLVIGELRHVMAEKGLTQREVARRMGITDAQLSLVIQCKRVNGITMRTLERIAKACGVTVELHLTDNGRRPELPAPELPEPEDLGPVISYPPIIVWQRDLRRLASFGIANGAGDSAVALRKLLDEVGAEE